MAYWSVYVYPSRICSFYVNLCYLKLICWAGILFNLVYPLGSVHLDHDYYQFTSRRYIVMYYLYISSGSCMVIFLVLGYVVWRSGNGETSGNHANVLICCVCGLRAVTITIIYNCIYNSSFTSAVCGLSECNIEWVVVGTNCPDCV